MKGGVRVSVKLWHHPSAPDPDDGLVWELLHESSKMGRYGSVAPEEEVARRMRALWESLPFEQCPGLELPPPTAPLTLSVGDAIARRTSARKIEPRNLSREELSTLLHCGYGVTRTNEGTLYPRPFRTVPSAGALYPLEILFYSTRVNGLEPGIYHYHASRHALRLLKPGNHSQALCEAVVQGELVLGASLLFFITALFERSVFKYGDRGYRFALLEAGHVAQNLNLAATALGMGAVNIGGYFDHAVDELLGLDGLLHSTVYLLAAGRAAEAPPAAGGAG